MKSSPAFARATGAHARVERQQDRLSRNIYQQKHDGWPQSPDPS